MANNYMQIKNAVHQQPDTYVWEVKQRGSRRLLVKLPNDTGVTVTEKNGGIILNSIVFSLTDADWRFWGGTTIYQPTVGQVLAVLDELRG